MIYYCSNESEFKLVSKREEREEHVFVCILGYGAAFLYIKKDMVKRGIN
jgi:hypothetical protein